MIFEVIKGFIALFIIFVPLEKFFSHHQQKIFRLDWGTDAIYYFTGYFLGKAGNALCASVALLLTAHLIRLESHGWIATQSVWVQLPAAIVIADLGYYLAHRLLHTVSWLWRFHAVHHSVEEMDWLATVRVHPLDQLFTKFFQMLPLYALGFSGETLTLYALFSAAIAFFIHANLRLNLGILRWMFATPEFHHWHHANQPGVRNKNFAAQLPLMDLIFGTAYLPREMQPSKYGLPSPMPIGYLQQLLHPFLGQKTARVK